MTDRPIIFSGPMVMALLREVREPGTGKTMTRRLLYTRRKIRGEVMRAEHTFLLDHPPPIGRLGPAGFPTDIAPNECWTLTGWHDVKPGTRLWVRESLEAHSYKDPRVMYSADETIDKWAREWPRSWKRHNVPSIHCPRALSRLTLVVTAVRIEPLQRIRMADARAEGVFDCHPTIPRGWFDADPRRYVQAFEALWERLNGSDSWKSNPDVVALTFKVHLANVDELREAA